MRRERINSVSHLFRSSQIKSRTPECRANQGTAAFLRPDKLCLCCIARHEAGRSFVAFCMESACKRAIHSTRLQRMPHWGISDCKKFERTMNLLYGVPTGPIDIYPKEGLCDTCTYDANAFPSGFSLLRKASSMSLGKEHSHWRMPMSAIVRSFARSNAVAVFSKMTFRIQV